LDILVPFGDAATVGNLDALKDFASKTIVLAATTLYEGNLVKASSMGGLQKRKFMSGLAQEWTNFVGSDKPASDFVHPALAAVMQSS
jgi:hypothetical protein